MPRSPISHASPPGSWSRSGCSAHTRTVSRYCSPSAMWRRGLMRGGGTRGRDRHSHGTRHIEPVRDNGQIKPEEDDTGTHIGEIETVKEGDTPSGVPKRMFSRKDMFWIHASCATYATRPCTLTAPSTLRNSPHCTKKKEQKMSVTRAVTESEQRGEGAEVTDKHRTLVSKTISAPYQRVQKCGLARTDLADHQG